LSINVALKEIIADAAKKAVADRGIASVPDIILEPPKDKRLADLSTNIAMQICKQEKGLKPFALAGSIADIAGSEIEKQKLSVYIQKVEVKPPGFINLHFSERYLQDVVTEIAAAGERFGASAIGKGKDVLVEFVSANPTGPLSVAHGRQAAVGDAIANILDFCGFSVKREYYLNDEGNQILLLGKSIYARYCELLGEEELFPEDGYRGSYIYDIAKSLIEKQKGPLPDEADKRLKKVCDFGVDYIMKMIRKDLSDFGVGFDNYFSQHKLSESGKVEEALGELKKKNLLYEKDGALWFKSTEFGDDKDRVLKKSDGSYTYITPDIAYHEDKFRRGFDWLIDLWGPDHHGYIPRMKAASRAMGRDDKALSLLIVQLATISRDGVPVRMSTREGEFITLREVLDDVGKDVARFFFQMRRKDSHLDFDLELAKKESMENPVYYIQYAHARICGILEYKKKQKMSLGASAGLKLLKAPEELNVLRLLREFPDIIEFSARSLEPHRLIQYLMELASSFHSFYTQHRVVSDDKELTSARLLLAESLKTVFSKSLALLGASSPEKM